MTPVSHFHVYSFLNSLQVQSNHPTLSQLWACSFNLTKMFIFRIFVYTCVCLWARQKVCERGRTLVIPCPLNEPLMLSHMLYHPFHLSQGWCVACMENKRVPNVCQQCSAVTWPRCVFMCLFCTIFYCECKQCVAGLPKHSGLEGTPTQKQNRLIEVQMQTSTRKEAERGEGEGQNRRILLVKHTDCQQSSMKTCHSWSLRSLPGDWTGMHWSFIPPNRQCSFAPSTLCTTIVSARTLFGRIFCPFRFLEVSFQDIHWDPLRSQAIAATQTAVQDQAELTLSWLLFEPMHYRCLSFRIRLLDT